MAANMGCQTLFKINRLKRLTINKMTKFPEYPCCYMTFSKEGFFKIGATVNGQLVYQQVKYVNPQNVFWALSNFQEDINRLINE